MWFHVGANAEDPTSFRSPATSQASFLAPFSDLEIDKAYLVRHCRNLSPDPPSDRESILRCCQERQVASAPASMLDSGAVSHRYRSSPHFCSNSPTPSSTTTTAAYRHPFCRTNSVPYSTRAGFCPRCRLPTLPLLVLVFS